MKTINNIAKFKRLCELNPITLFIFTLVILVVQANGPNFAQMRKTLRPSLLPLVTKSTDPRHLQFKRGIGLNATNLFTTHKADFGLGTDDQMVNYQSFADDIGFRHYRFQQYYKGVPVEFATVVVNELNNEVKYLHGDYIEGINIRITPRLTEKAALQLALSHTNAIVYAWQYPSMENLLKEMENNPDATYYPKGTLCIVNDNIDNSGPVFHLAYKFDIYAISPLSRKYIYIDATTGEVLHEISRITNADQTGSASTRYSGLQTIMTTNHYFPLLWNYYTLKETGRGGGIETYNLKHDSVYGNAVPCKDDNNLWVIFDPAEDQIATDAHWGTEMTYDYYKNVHARNSYNNAGAKLNSYVHFKANYNNAFWNGDVMTYGDGNGVRFTPLTCMDVVAHEITHAVTQFSANLVYQAESGALNEGFSDIFGSRAEEYAKGNDWMIGEDITPGRPCMRSMSNPKSQNQPDTYRGKNWRNTGDVSEANDYGGVHRNCGVPNYWFYLLSEGGSGKNDSNDRYTVNGIGSTKAAKIAYRALTTKLNANSNFMGMRIGCIEAADDLFPGLCSEEVKQTTNAWYAVNVGDPTIQIDSSDVKKASCDSANGEIYVKVIGVSPDPPEYLWSNGETTQKITDLEPGTYSVTITDPNNFCEVDTTFEVEEDINFTTIVTGVDVTNCGGNDGRATVTVNNAVGTPDIIWSNGETSNTIQNLTKGWYYVWVTDTSTNCERKDSVEIKEPVIEVSISGGGTRTICLGDPIPDFTLTANATHCAGCTYHWSTGATSKSITVGPGSYSVTVSDTSGCSGEAGAVVYVWIRDCDDPDNPEWEIPIVSPLDPNEIVGPEGVGTEKFVSKSENQPYTIHFENDPEFATAPALRVTVDAPFDDKADMYSLRLGDFGFGDFVFTIPPNTAFYNERLDLRDSLGVFVDVTAGIDVSNNKAFWILQSIDPATGVEPSDPNLGFLLVNDSITNRGQGFVSFTQRAKANTVTGDTLHAQGSIIFDQNEVIPTNIWSNTIDAVAPQSQVGALPAETDSAWVQISVTGTDDSGGSGIKQYSLYSATAGEAFTFHKNYNPGDTIIFTGTPGSTYHFFSIATDRTGNMEAMKTAAEASIHFNVYRPKITGTLTYGNTNESPLNNVSLYLKNISGNIFDSTHTASNGSYTFYPLFPGDYLIDAVTAKVPGGFTATDALLVMNHFVFNDTLSPLGYKAGDVNQSQTLNAVDALLIARRFVQLIDVFPAGDWYFEKDTLAFNDSTVYNDFKGICFGDVDGSYQPSGKKNATVMLLNEEEKTLRPGEEMLVPVNVYDDVTVGAISLVLGYPEELIEVTGVQANTEKSGDLVFSARNGIVRIAWYSTSPIKLPDGGTLLYLKVKAKDLLNPMIAVFSLGKGSTLADGKAKELQDVKLYIPQMKIDIPMNYYLLGNRPNPFNGKTIIEYGLPEKGLVSLKVYSLLGDEMAVLVNERQGTGSYKVEFDAGNFTDGVYIARFEAQGEKEDFQQSLRMVLIR